jgi:DNA segregation ATPase FtsK/SpoIIIE-like protein
MKPKTNYWVDSEQYIKEAQQIADDIYDIVVQKAIENQSVSVAWVQGTFDVCYHTAAFIVDRMESEGICEPYSGDRKPRKIIINGV